MTLRNKERPSASNNYGRGNQKRKQPEPSPVSSRLLLGLAILAVLIVSVVVLFKPYPLFPRTESLEVIPSTEISADAVQKALVATGALPDPTAVKVNPDGKSFAVVSADAKNPVSTTTWQALARTLPGKLTGAKVEYRATGSAPINLGLDLRGGLRVLLEAQGPVPTREDLDQVRNVIENRVNQTGVAEPLVQIQGERRIVVELPGLSQADQTRATSLIGKTAKLEFRMLKPEAQSKGESELIPSVDLEPTVMTGEDIAKAQTAFDQFGRPVVSFELTARGAQKFSEVTGANVGKRFAIVLDDVVQSAPNIQERLGAQAQITGNFTLEQANDLALVLRSGALRIPVEIVETRAIGPTLGQDAISQGITAALIGVGAVFALLYIYYGLWFGTVAALGLIFSGLVIAGVFSGLGVVLTLPGIAGLVLTIGAAVDGNVISFERIKEELRLGKSLKSSIKSGFESSFSAIWDSNFTNLLAAVALYNYGTGPVRGFAVTLAVGVIVTVFSNIVVSRYLLEALAVIRPKANAPQWFVTPKINFIGLSRYVTMVSLVLAILGAIVIFAKGFTFGVDFTSGTAYTLRTALSVTSEDVRGAIGGSGIAGITSSGATIIESQTPGVNGKDFTVRVSELNDANRERLEVALEKLPQGFVKQSETVGPTVGNELRAATIWAVVVALGLTLVYIGFRFDIVFGGALVLAVAHNVAIVLGLYSALGREFTINTVAAILTLIGFALNDAIIVSDRIRENLKLMRGESYATIVNASINQTLSRTVMTSLSAMLPLVALLVFGGPVLRDFSLVVLVGFIIGTYSSIVIVSPMIVYFKDWQQRNRKPPRMAKV
jgi:SecD/SecF fusion protein